MIKMFCTDRYNWVDEKGNFIGVENGIQCCEDFGYVYLNNLDELNLYNPKTTNNELEDLIENQSLDYNGLEFGNFIDDNPFSIEILDNNKIVGYLVIFNEHNGFYYHFLNGRIKGVKIEVQL